MTMMEAALCYAKRDWAVFPLHSVEDGRCSCGKPSCSSAGKHPRVKWKTDASRDQARIKQWWERWPHANVGISTGDSGLVVLDIDVKNGRDGWASLAVAGIRLPSTLRAITGSGGGHLYFSSDGHVIRNHSDFLPGLDIRAAGGYVVAPPSGHVLGSKYEWVDPESEVACLPAPLLEQLACSAPKPTALRPERPALNKSAPRVQIIDAGTRNTTLTSMAGVMRQVGFDTTAIISALAVHNRLACQPALPDHEVREITQSVSRYSPGIPLTGGVFLARSIIERLMERPQTMRVFLWLVSRAAWRDGARLRFGQVQFSYGALGRALAEERNNQEIIPSKATLKRSVQELAALGILEVLGTRPRTTVQVVAFEQYRGIPIGGASRQ